LNHKTTLHLLRVLALFAVADLGRPLKASTAFLFPDPATGTSSAVGTDGFEFRPDTDILVTALGYYDRNQDGLTLAHPVAIYDMNSGSQLALTIVGPGSGSSLLGLFQYKTISPLRLQAGKSYMVAGFHPGSGGNDLAADFNPATAVTIASGLTYQGYFYSFNSSLTLPATAGSPEMFFGPNFQFQAVPEPSTTVFFAVGGLALIALAHLPGRAVREIYPKSPGQRDTARV
jgi:hypothetical protein